MVEQATGRADQNVGATFQLAVLLFEGHAADQQGHVELVILAVFLEVLGNLCREFAGRLENQRARHAGAGAALFEQRQHRENERCGLAGASLRDAENIPPLQGRRNCACLDRCWNGVAGIGDGRKDFLAQAKVSKSGQREVVSVPVLANIAL